MHEMPSFEWTSEHVEEIKVMAGGGKSADQIAVHLGITKNMVIGKMVRMGSPLSTLQPLRPKRQREGRAKTKLPDHLKSFRLRPRPILDPSITPEPNALNIPFLNLTANHCRWPTHGDGQPAIYCGHPKDDGSSYCAHHHRVGTVRR
jgi:GcrA cell cycle regulator